MLSLFYFKISLVFNLAKIDIFPERTGILTAKMSEYFYGMYFDRINAKKLILCKPVR